MRRAGGLALGMAAVLVIIAATMWEVSNSRTFQFFGDLVSRVPTTEKVVALTFDDGPSDARVDALVDALRQADVRATFFVVGSELAANPSAGRRLVAAGHELANHRYSHQRLLLKSPAFVEREVVQTDELIRAAGQVGPIAFRPPYGKKLFVLPFYLAQTGLTTVTWDIEPDSYSETASTAEGIAARAGASTAGLDNPSARLA